MENDIRCPECDGSNLNEEKTICWRRRFFILWFLYLGMLHVGRFTS